MTIRTFRARTPAEALAQVKRELGPDAVILNTRTTQTKGLLGLGARSLTEITATTTEHAPPRRPRTRAAARVVAPPPPPPDVSHARDLVQLSGAAPPAAEPTRAAAVAVAEPPSTPPTHAPAPQAPAREVAARILDPEPSPDLRSELAAIKRMVGHVLRSGTPGGGAIPEALERQYLRLIEAEVARELAEQVVGTIRAELSPAELDDERAVRAAVLRHVAHHIPVAPEVPSPSKPADGRARTIALIGPTGVGKTTTIAKLAATHKLRDGKKVALVTSDTYRIAAVDQLRTYANIIGLRLEVALTPQDMTRACRSLADHDVILIDTAGRSQHDAQRIDELTRFLHAADPHEVHLVLSSTASEAVLRRTVEVFAQAGPTHAIFTKLDEAVGLGVVLSTLSMLDARLSFVTTGQEVPDQIERACADRLARLIVDGGGP